MTHTTVQEYGERLYITLYMRVFIECLQCMTSHTTVQEYGERLYIAPYVRVFMLLTDGGQQNLSHYKKISVKYSGATISLWEQLIGTSFVVSPLLFFLFLLDFWFPFLVCTFFSSFVLIVAVLLFAHNEVISCFGFLFIGKSKTMCVSD